MSLVQWARGVPHFKPEKGTSLRDRKQRRKDVETFEDQQKTIVRRRDRQCRWPHCENCKKWKPRLEVAHLDPKGFGGDHGLKSSADQMILLDWLTHQGGLTSLEQHGRRIVPLTAEGTNGPCEFWIADERGGWTLVASETSIGVYRRD